VIKDEVRSRSMNEDNKMIDIPLNVVSMVGLLK
jgi:hypothetical protein